MFCVGTARTDLVLSVKPVSTDCARSDRDCRKCTFHSCNCTCHKEKHWKQVLKHHNRLRYFMAPGKSGIWYVMDRGTLQTPTTKVMAKCKNRLDAYRMTQALNKAAK